MFMLGSDPEAFVQSEGSIIPIVGMLGGTKEIPLDVGDGYFVQEDNVMAEGNIPPATSAEEFSGNINTLIERLTERLPGLSFAPFHYFQREQLVSAGRQALAFGCEPDFNAWTGSINRPPSPYTEMRTAAGHIHIGYDNPNKAKSSRLVQLCDLYAGLPSVVMQPDCERRKMYGKAGACRYKDYGVEYRVLSNFWVGDTSLHHWAWNAMERAYNSLSDHAAVMAEVGSRIPAIINDNLVSEARAICDDMEIAYA